MVGRWRDGTVPPVALDPAIASDLSSVESDVAELLDRVEPSAALEAIWKRVRRLNQYVEETAPWVLAKDPAGEERLDQVLASLIEGVRVVTVALHAFMPESTERLLAALSEPDTSWSAAACRDSGSGLRVGPRDPLFPKP